MVKVLSAFGKIALLRERYYKLAVKKKSLLKLISENELADQVYNSNAIENSTLTLDETEKILLKVEIDRYISERELFEAKNLAKVVSYIDKTAKDKELDLEIILFLHKILLSNIRDEIAGRFREKDEWVRVANYIAPDPKLVVKKLEDALVEYQASASNSIIKRIAKFHLDFEHIHPFVDGNGRIGRVLNNYLLIREGFVPINIKFVDRKLYYEAFQEFDLSTSTKIMEEIIAKALTSSYYKRLAYLEGKEIVSLSEYAKRKKLSYTNLLNKANRQTIEAFLERGKWKIGI